MCGGLERQSGAGLRYPFTITLAPTGLVNVCPVKVLFSSRSTGIAPPPSPMLVGGPRIYHFPTFYVRGRLSEETYRFYLLVVAFFKFASVFGDGWPNVCVIDAELAPFYGAPMVG